MSCNKNRQYDNLKTPPSISGEEVSARWKRTYSGEVIITVRMPHDTVDSEVYMKTRASKWIQGCPQPGRGIGPHSTPPQGDQGQVDKVQKGENPEAHQPTQDFWKTPDEEPQMLVPQTK